MGDFNHGNITLDTLQSTGVEDQTCLCLVHDNFLNQHVSEPTRAARVLDIVLASQKEFVDNVVVQEPLGSSDHNQLHFTHEHKIRQNKSRRDFRKGIYFTLLYFTLLYFTLLYFTVVGVVSSDVSRSSCTTYFTPCCSIFSQSYVFFQGCPCPLLDAIDVLHPRAPSSSFPRHNSENACLYSITLIVSACMSKQSHFSFDNLGKEFASSLKFIQYALVCPFRRPTYP